MNKIILSSSILMAAMAMSTSAISAEKPALTLQDIMAFETAQKPVLSRSGNLMAVSVLPDRGDARGLVKFIDSEKRFTIVGGTKPVISPQGRYVAFIRPPSLLTKETASKKEAKKLKNDLVLLDTQTGEQTDFLKVKAFKFSEQDSHLVVLFEPQDKEDKKEKDKAADSSAKVQASKGEAKESEAKVDKFDKGSRLQLVDLNSGDSNEYQHVTDFALSGANTHLAIAINDIEGQTHSVKLISIGSPLCQPECISYQSDKQQVSHLALSPDGQQLAFTHGEYAAAPYGREYQLGVAKIGSTQVRYLPYSKGWALNRYAEPEFSTDSQRLFVGRVPEVKAQESLPKIETEQDLFDLDTVTAQRNLRVWHGDDPRIKPNEVKEYGDEQKRTYLAVWHLKSNKLVQLATQSVPNLEAGDELKTRSRWLLASSDLPYRKMITWAGFYRDFYLVNIQTGQTLPLLSQQPSRERPSLSPNENFVVYYQQGHFYLYDIKSGRKQGLTQNLKVSFANEDHDYPANAPSYGIGPWLEKDAGVIIYDKYDIWQFDTKTAKGEMLTAGKGRKQQVQYRVTGLTQSGLNVDDKPISLKHNEAVLLHGYNTGTKADGFYKAKIGQEGVAKLMQGEYKLTFLARAEKSEEILFSKQRFDLYPDIYASKALSPEKALQQTDLDAQRRKFNWGQAELVSWQNGDGKPLDGVLIKPANYQEGKRYPVLVYFYRFMSDRLHAFPKMQLNHRPNFAWYLDNGYAVFLPDIRFEVGYPGPSSVQALISGVQHIIDMGVAKADAIGLQGHSWGGYQTAFAVTQTPIFAAAVSGAPVSNMTSAYSGIRHGTGLARQFQYETGQSRIGETLFDAPHKYIENSPVFYAERIKTPMMIMFGDKDDAVPWEQGVELYLAMRRAGKDVVFLQYQDEPHHLKKYPNKLDYTIRMKQYFDHYLKGTKAPKWLKEGEAYQEYKAD